MAVVPKKRAGGKVVYYVATKWRGKQYWKHAGKDKREAERLDARRTAAVKDGTFTPDERPMRPTVAEYIETWGKPRANASADDDRRNLARFAKLEAFASLHLDEVRPRHVIAAVEEIKTTVPSVKTAKNAYGTLRTLFRDAVIAEYCAASPCVLPRGMFDHESEERAPYTRDEAATLITAEVIPWPIRVLNALCLLGGLREGEACGRRWSDLDPGARGADGSALLAALDVRTQYEGRKLKTRKPRLVPVHPELLAVLEEWAKVGFARLTGRGPLPEDFIVPLVSRRSKKRHHTRSTYYKAFVAGARAAGVSPRSLHSTRHTMITLARRGGARKDVLALVTHNAKGDIVDRYTHLDWLPLCEAVLAIGSLFGSRPTPRLPPANTDETARDVRSEVDAEDRESAAHAQSGAVFNSRRLHYDPAEKRQLQEDRPTQQPNSSAISGDLPRSLERVARERVARLERLAEVDPDAARVPLALARGVVAAYRDDPAELERQLSEALPAGAGRAG